MLSIPEVLEKHKEIEQELSKPEVINDKEKYARLSREYNNLSKIIAEIDRLEKIEHDIEEFKEMLRSADDDGFKEEVLAEIERLKKEREKLESSILYMLVPPDPLNEKNIIMEIRAGTGGEEAALFAADLFRMYSRFCERKNWKIEVLSSNETGIGGYKEIIFSISGKDVYQHLKFEKGVHRVQRIPVTESGGRIHTSAVTVAVLPEAEETDVEIDPDDLRIDVFRASGHGGQHVNTTDSAVRITHLPTGLVVTCQDEKSQHKNKERAMKVLRARLYDMYEQQRKREEAEERRSQIGSGDRSERIRTYNFPQNRVTDHRINLTLYKLDAILDGELDELIEALLNAEAKQILKGVEISKKDS